MTGTTMFILITAIVLVVGLALVSIGIVLAAGILWQGRRIGDAAGIRADLDTVDTKIENLSEMFQSYVKRDAQRISTASKRATKAEKVAQEEEEKQVDTEPQSVIVSAEDIVARYERQTRNGGSR